MDYGGYTFQDQFPGIDRYRRTTPNKTYTDVRRSPSKAEVDDILTRINKLKNQRPTPAATPTIPLLSRPDPANDFVISQLTKQHAEEIENLQAAFDAEMAAKIKELEVAYTDQHKSHRQDFEGMVNGYQKAQGDLADLHAAMKEQRSSEREQKGKSERLELKIIEYQKTIDMQSKEIQSLQGNVKRLKKFERFKSQYEDAAEEVNKLTERNAELKHALAQKTAQQPRLERKLSKLKSRLANQSQSNILEEKLDEERKIRQQLDEEYRKLVGEISEMKAKVQKTIHGEYQEKIEDLQYQLAKTTDRLRNQPQQDSRARSVDRVRIPTREAVEDPESISKWKNKATELVTRYYDALKQLRKEMADMKIEAMKEMHEMQKNFDRTLEQIISHYTDALEGPRY